MFLKITVLKTDDAFSLQNILEYFPKNVESFIKTGPTAQSIQTLR